MGSDKLILLRIENYFMIRDKNEGNKMLWKYAGMGTQFFVAIGLGIFLGLKLDKWVNISIPLMVWLLPLLLIIGMIIKIVIETSKKQ